MLPDLEAFPANLADHPASLFVQSQVNGYDQYSTIERKRLLATYYGQIMAVDTAIGRILEELEANGQLDYTVIVFTGICSTGC